MKKGSKNILPILFNTEMVRDILEGRKTVTRRVVTPQPPAGVTQLYHGAAPGRWRSPGKNVWVEIRAPYQPGDILWVRETWAAWSPTYGTEPRLIYKADDNVPSGVKWNPSIHMPREAARIFLRVTGLRVERLQDITEAQAKAEGASMSLPAQKDPEYAEYIGGYYRAFSDLWDSTIKPADRAAYGWDANPWVWVINFERISKEEAELEQ